MGLHHRAYEEASFSAIIGYYMAGKNVDKSKIDHMAKQFAALSTDEQHSNNVNDDGNNGN